MTRVIHAFSFWTPGVFLGQNSPCDFGAPTSQPALAVQRARCPRSVTAAGIVLVFGADVPNTRSLVLRCVPSLIQQRPKLPAFQALCSTDRCELSFWLRSQRNGHFYLSSSRFAILPPDTRLDRGHRTRGGAGGGGRHGARRAPQPHGPAPPPARPLRAPGGPEGPGHLRRRSRPRLPAAALSPGAPLGCQREAATCSGAESLLAARREGEQPPRHLPRPRTAARGEKLPPRSAAGGKSPAGCRRRLAASPSPPGPAAGRRDDGAPRRRRPRLLPPPPAALPAARSPLHAASSGIVYSKCSIWRHYYYALSSRSTRWSDVWKMEI